MKKINWFNLSWLLLLLIAIVVRFWGLGRMPVSPYWEEVALGYDAYSIAMTGADHHGNEWPLVAFESFEDWKPSLYFYLTAPLVALFGLTVAMVRLPSAVAGIMIVVGVYFLTKKVTGDKKIAWWSMLVVALSPWAIQFSRSAWEANVATALVLWGANCWLESEIVLKNIFMKEKKKNIGNNYFLKNWSGWLLLIGTVLLILSLYTYHAAKIVAPVLGVILLIRWILVLLKGNTEEKLKKNQWQKQFKIMVPHFLMTLIISSLLLIPIIQNFSNPAFQERWKETNVFNNGSEVIKSNKCREESGNSGLSWFFCHRFWMQTETFLENFSQFFNLDFLFFGGDENIRHTTGWWGIFYPLDVLFLLTGLLSIVTVKGRAAWLNVDDKKTGNFIFIVLWIILSILPAALSSDVGHALRILLGLPAWMILISLGINVIIKFLCDLIKKSHIRVKSQFGASLIVLVIISLQFILWWTHYWAIYSKTAAEAWGDGYSQVFLEINKQLEKNDLTEVYMTRAKGRPSMYLFFFNKLDPKIVQAQMQAMKKDKGELVNLNWNERKWSFIRTTNEIKLDKESLVVADPVDMDHFINTIIASSNKELREDDQEKCWNVEILTDIKAENGNTVWQIGILRNISSQTCLNDKNSL